MASSTFSAAKVPVVAQLRSTSIANERFSSASLAHSKSYKLNRKRHLLTLRASSRDNGVSPSSSRISSNTDQAVKPATSFYSNGDIVSEKLDKVMQERGKDKHSDSDSDVAQVLAGKKKIIPRENLPKRPSESKVKPVWKEYTEADYLEKQSDRESPESMAPEKIERKKYLEFRKRMNIRLSETNASNRHLRRQVLHSENEIVRMQNKIKLIEDKLKDLVIISKEIAAKPANLATVKFRGKFVLSYIANSIEEIHSDIKEQVAEVNAMAIKEVDIEWYGVAEDVRIMGSFDDWTSGEQMSPEVSGAYTRFFATLRLRPGTYEIKFLVDGNWKLVSDWPQVGTGLTANNVLVVR